MAKMNFSGATSEEKAAFYEGVEHGRNDPDVHAYYAGVGYGKKSGGSRHVGFKSQSERAAFDRGFDARDRHFIAVEKEEPSWIEKLFGLSKKKKKASNAKRRVSKKTPAKKRKTRKFRKRK